MSAEVFRFMSIRPVQQAPGTLVPNVVDLTGITSDFLTILARARETGGRAEMEKHASGFVRGESFIDARRKVDGKFLAFHEALLALPGAKFAAAARELHVAMLGQPSDYLDRNEFRALLVGVTDGLTAAAIDLSVSPRVRALLVALARTIGLIRRLAAAPAELGYSRADFLTQSILLPAGIFPLPTTDQDFSAQDEAEAEKRERREADRKQLAALSEELAVNRGAIDEILATYEKVLFTPGKAVTVVETNPQAPTGPGGFELTAEEAGTLSPATKGALKKAGFEGTVDVARATALIEKRSGDIAGTLYKSGNAARYLVNLGTGLVPSDAILAGDISIFETPGNALRHPGPCAPTPPVANSDAVTVPLWTTHGSAKILGFADLMLVEQNLVRYELGEIAHIENVLIGELREREFKTATTTEQSIETEIEITDEKTKDLSSSERFELQSESEKVISESSATQAGVTVNASYGPSVDVTANFGYTSTTAVESSNSVSSSFARDTTSKATSRIQKRTLERRLSRTVSQVEEINRHGFENRQTDAENVTGVYRFVDKIYKAQIVNYGKRFMLEFVVPEPAAFLRHAVTRQPAEGISHVKPDEPGYCSNGVFVALQPQDITRDNYLFWASKYRADDVAPPPPATQIVSGVLKTEAAGSKSQFTDDIYDTQELPDLKVPGGYKPTRAIVSAEGWNVAKQNSHPSHLVLQIQKEIVEIPHQAVITVNLESDVTDKIPIAVVAKNYERYAIVASVFCVITREKFEEWQLATYSAIMAAYNDLKTRYDTALEALRIKTSFNQIAGTNPAANREREKVELKKGCLALLTGQNFEAFDSVRRNVAPHGYPEIAFADAEAEGRYVQFFENAFEWVNMLYIFYPYFWGRKEDWVTISQIADTDPLYERFLQAGSARVQVPVRPGFEVGLANFLGLKSFWEGEGSLVTAEDDHIPEDLYVSILDELKEQLGNQMLEGQGRLTVEKGSKIVIGEGTGFTADDELRRIVVNGVTYVIDRVVGETEIALATAYAGESGSGLRYATGVKLVGQSWEVRLPTELVVIEKEGQSLIQA